MGKQYPLDYPLTKKRHLDRVIFLIYALPLGSFGIIVGRSRNNFGVKLTP